MPFIKQTIPLEKTSLFSSLFVNYLNADKSLKRFYRNHFFKSNFRNFLAENTFSLVNRETLVESLRHQSACVDNTTASTLTNISSLLDSKTFTVTTGHQLCLFTGPLYFIYKIISTINLCERLRLEFPEFNFVPIYWMASEDHDFEEINHVNVFGKKIVWKSEQKGAVGAMQTVELSGFLSELKTVLGESVYANELVQLFEKAYIQNTRLDDATRYLVNELFGEFGLVTLDGNDTGLKALFKQEFKNDIFDSLSFNKVNSTIAELKKDYSIQVTPREINVFYLQNGSRERIEKWNDGFRVVNTMIEFSQDEILQLIENSPERFSPNVVLRPLYQQKILPNLAYVGGPGELAYWLEYKEMFEAFQIPMPILMPRNFVTILDKNTLQKMQKLELEEESLFKEGEELVKHLIKSQHREINLEDFKSRISALYIEMTDLVASVDKSLRGAVEAEKQKTLNGLANIEQKIGKALKQKSESDVNQIWSLKEKLFPSNLPQERHENFSMNYLKHGRDFIAALKQHLTYDLEKFEYLILKEV